LCILLAPAGFAQFQYERLKSFGFPEASGRHPNALIEAGDGVFYGTTEFGGTNDAGTVFKVNKDGTDYRVLHHFSGTSANGGYPTAGLIEGSDGALYGTTPGIGVAFRPGKDGSGYSVLHIFSFGAGNDGSDSRAGLIEGSDGALYGTTWSGGTADNGTVFKFNKDGSGYTLLHSFTGTGGDGSFPRAALLEGSDGALYGTTAEGGSNELYGTVFKLNKDGSGYTILHNYINRLGQGFRPLAALIEGSDGALYGTSYDSPTGPVDTGAVFKLNKDRSGFSIVYVFLNDDGDNPQDALVESDSTLYGTTDGTVFSLNEDGSGYSVLSRLTGGPRGLFQASDGALYGTTGDYDGTMFKLNKDGSGYAQLRTFPGTGGDGSHPKAALVEGRDGWLYGATSQGGNYNAGSVFKLKKDGGGYVNLHSFAGNGGDGSDGLDGRFPQAALVESSDGAIYGTTSGGGTNDAGTVFRLNKDGSGYTILHIMATELEGRGPNGLVEASDGVLYGTSSQGGTNGEGTVFKLNKDGSNYHVLHDFWPQAGDGSEPLAALVECSDGALYGTTEGPFGAIFKLSPRQQNLWVNSSGSGSRPSV
jgi:uncharacterized repeat protein (TIGR03803 family)